MEQGVRKWKPKSISDSMLRSSRLLAVGEGFEPPVPFRYAGFQDRCLKPLGHPTYAILAVFSALWSTGRTPENPVLAVFRLLRSPKRCPEPKNHTQEPIPP